MITSNKTPALRQSSELPVESVSESAMFMFVTVRADTGWQLASGKHAARAWHNGIVGHYFYFLTAQGKMIGEHILSSFHHLEGFWSIF